MRRHWSSRLFSACLAVWFVLSVGEPSFVHLCPMHGGGAVEHAGMGGAHAHGAHGHGAHRGAANDSPTSDHHAHHCSCISCCIGAGAAALAAPPVSLPDAVAFDANAPIVTPETLPRLAPPYTLPLATGPPRV
jgi:hypothetical protein